MGSGWEVEITYVAFDLYSSYAMEFIQATTLSRFSLSTEYSLTNPKLSLIVTLWILGTTRSVCRPSAEK